MGTEFDRFKQRCRAAVPDRHGSRRARVAGGKEFRPLAKDDDYRIYEYACHEANYAVGNILRGARRSGVKNTR